MADPPLPVAPIPGGFVFTVVTTWASDPINYDVVQFDPAGGGMFGFSHSLAQDNNAALEDVWEFLPWHNIKFVYKRRKDAGS